MADFNPLNFIANHAGMNLVDAIKEAYEQGKKDAQPDFDMTEKIDKAYDDGYKQGYLQGKADYERKPGKWIRDELYPTYAKCSICGYSDEYTYEDNYCPNCGCRMLKEGEEHETD